MTQNNDVTYIFFISLQHGWKERINPFHNGRQLLKEFSYFSLFPSVLEKRENKPILQREAISLKEFSYFSPFPSALVKRENKPILKREVISQGIFIFFPLFPSALEKRENKPSLQKKTKKNKQQQQTNKQTKKKRQFLLRNFHIFLPFPSALEKRENKPILMQREAVSLKKWQYKPILQREAISQGIFIFFPFSFSTGERRE